jgi:predicted glycogen debranching enzyme
MNWSGEWLETNGIGGFASSTISGLNTRRYHGLLVAATQPPVGRMMLLSKLEETLVVSGRRIELGTNQYPGVVHPAGHRFLAEFRRDPLKVFAFQTEGVRVSKRVFMVYGENTTVVEYEVSGGGECELELRPLTAFRDYHALTHENGAIARGFEAEAGLVRYAAYPGAPALYLAHSGGRVEEAGYWYRNFEYTRELERGLDYREDLFNPLVLRFQVGAEGRAVVVASTEARRAEDANWMRARELDRRAAIARHAPPDGDLARRLTVAADQFVVKRGAGRTVIAGYHWFSDWGRDTMIALPGLTLATGRGEEALGILRAFAASVDRGMLPNRFPDAGEAPEYNTVDATLWFFEAVRATAAQLRTRNFVDGELYGVLADIVAWHERGTRYGIHVDEDGLVAAGEPGVQLTWMDAKCGDWVVTPRQGKPVEIQALWYNALRVMEALSRGTDRAKYRDLAERARRSFLEQFWNSEAGCLFDVVDGERRDGSIRPNQIFAVSLFHKMLAPEQAARVVEVVRQQLLTPYGLRTLARGDPRYRGRYEGNPNGRDSAYHQGTVWPWLMGPFISAYLQVNGGSRESRAQARDWLGALRRYVEEEGSVPEVFDGDEPQRAGGCIAQAWSVGELLRVAVEAAG